MITLLVILLVIVAAIIAIVLTGGAFVVSFGWILFIIGDIAIGVWLLVKIIKRIFKK